MNRFRFVVFAAIIACLLGVHAASAQTAANVLIISGNGQMICQNCSPSPNVNFQPLVVKVTDANGNPIPGATVNWNIVQGGGSLNSVTVADAFGVSANFFFATGASSFTTNVDPGLDIVTATSGSASTTFFETEVYNALGFGSYSPDVSQLPVSGTRITGAAGTAGTPLTFRALTFGGTPLPGVVMRLVNFSSNATATCATGTGAEPGTVLTDATGTATCTPIFAGSGSGQFVIEMGGTVVTSLGGNPVTPPFIRSDAVTEYAYGTYPSAGAINITVTAASVGSVAVVSGNNQSANAGQSTGAPLVVKVQTTAGTGLAGQTVTWTVSPAGAATVSSSSVTDANGQASTTLTLASNATGPVTVTAASGGKSTTFTVTAVPLVSISGLQILSGNNQAAIVNTAFSNPLIVQVNASNGQPASGVLVQFSPTGSITLSQTSATTNSSGQAQVTATAGNTAGNASVTASAGGFTQTFNLSVSPPGPNLSAGSIVNGADFQVNSVSPCSIATIFAPGVAPNVQGVVGPTFVGSLPYTVATGTVTLGGAQSPIYNVANMNNQQQITFQVPCTTLPGANQLTVAVGAGSSTISVNVLPASPGIFQTTMSDGRTRAVAVRPDGTFVSIENPARRGENIMTFVTGLGPVTPSVGTNALPVVGTAANVNYPVIVGVANAGVPLNFARLSEDLIGVYVVSFTVPTNSPTGNDVVFSVGVAPPGAGRVYYSAGSSLPIQ